MEPYSIDNLWDEFDLRISSYRYLNLDRIDMRLANWIGSMDYSGFDREECTRNLVKNYLAGDENRILVRLDDWVFEVQAVANDWALKHFWRLPDSAILSNQDLLVWLSRKERAQATEAWAEITQDLVDRAEVMDDPDFYALKLQFRRLLYELSLKGKQRLRKRIIHDPDPVTRMLLLNPEKSGSLSEPEFRSFRTDKSNMVRRRFLRWRISHGIVPEKEELMAQILSKSPGSRDVARFYLKKFYHVDAYEFYRGLPGEDFFLISDFKRPADVDHFMKGVQTAEAKHVREACLRALVDCEPERLQKLDVSALIRENQKTRGLVAKALPQFMSINEIQEYEVDFLGSSSSGPQVYARMVLKISIWRFVQVSLRLLRNRYDNAIWELLLKKVVRNSQIAEPLSDRLREELRKDLGEVEMNVLVHRDEKIIEELGFILKTHP